MKYISGDKNSNSKLDITETWTYTCRTKLTATTTNTATASGEANGMTVRDFAIATVVAAPGVTNLAAYTPRFPRAGFAPVENVFIWSIAAVGVFTASFLIYIIRRKKNS